MKTLLCLLSLLAPAWLAAEQPGLKVGETAPDFTLASSAGGSLSLKTALAQGPVALIFVRSADWCPFCRRQLEDLQTARAAIEAAGVQLIAVSYDAPATGAAAAKKLGLIYPLLADPDSKVISAYGILNHEVSGKGAGIAHPVAYILDRQGVIRAKLMRDNYRDRPESAELIAAAKALP
ncbi:Putative peroxiredoxin [Lacunisphaera limnophila]|uniref:thioredoxin-dependent peroxiredoxin n=1 Tax=Lacunisphaera limnophila TaxID=1838286 RepID=A0A1D8ASG2_9BACT|nr:peroxiredoxin family protein [Lacunisphaera limnophila]AOS43838.1 Putative peroxiredoxin [Lacunisphaera limnophila]